MKRTMFLAATTMVAFAGPVAAQEWQGPYLGGYAGYSMLENDEDEITVFDTDQDGRFNNTVRTGAGADAFSPGFCDGTPNANNAGAGCSDDEDNGGEFGLRGGYDWQRGALVFGVVGELGYASGDDSVTAFSTTPANYAFKRNLDWLAAARVRVGYATGRFLPYVTGGVATGNVNSTFSSSNTANSFTPSRRDDMETGWQLGGGVETKVSDRWSVGLEYLYTDLDVDPHVVRVGPGTAPATNPFLLVNPTGTDMRRTDNNLELHSLRLTAAMRF